MAPTLSPIRVTPEDYPDTRASHEHMEYLVYGLRQATQHPRPVSAVTVPADGDHPAWFAWEAFCDEVAEELAPQVAELLDEAMRARLPWTWEPER